MRFDAPFQLGPFSVSPEGCLALVTPQSLPRFEINWHGCRIQARLRLREDDNSLGELSLHAVVGRVPSTARPTTRTSGRSRTAAEAAPSPRGAVFEALRTLPATLPEGWRADLLADHSVTMLSASRVEMPTTAASLLTDMTLFLLALGPYLELLAELGVEALPAS